MLLHITSLRSAYGSGDLGSGAFGWVERLDEVGQSWWQALPRLAVRALLSASPTEETMQDVGTRLLEEWKANLDLLKFYEQLKQQRFSHFLTIQTAFIATVALLAKEALGVFSLVPLVALAMVPIAPLFISFYFLRLDARNRAFIDTANTKLLLLEDEWKDHFPENHFATYHDQFGVLSLRNADLVENYRAARNLAKDPYETLVQAPSSHATETSILRLFYWLWILVATAGVLHLIWQLAHAHWNPT